MSKVPQWSPLRHAGVAILLSGFVYPLLVTGVNTWREAYLMALVGIGLILASED